MNEGAAADQAHARLQAILKAVVVGRGVADAASRETGESETLFQSAGALVRPYDPEALCLLVEHSNALRQNLDGFGHRLEPAIDFEVEDANARVADAMQDLSLLLVPGRATAMLHNAMIACREGRREGRAFAILDQLAGFGKGGTFGVVGFEADEGLEERKHDLVYPKRIIPLTTDPGLPRYVDGSCTPRAPATSSRRTTHDCDRQPPQIS